MTNPEINDLLAGWLQEPLTQAEEQAVEIRDKSEAGSTGRLKVFNNAHYFDLDFCEFHDAMNHVFVRFNLEQRIRYLAQLKTLCESASDVETLPVEVLMVFATPRQKAMAAIKSLGLGKESETQLTEDEVEILRFLGKETHSVPLYELKAILTMPPQRIQPTLERMAKQGLLTNCQLYFSDTEVGRSALETWEAAQAQ